MYDIRGRSTESKEGLSQEKGQEDSALLPGRALTHFRGLGVFAPFDKISK